MNLPFDRCLLIGQVGRGDEGDEDTGTRGEGRAVTRENLPSTSTRRRVSPSPRLLPLLTRFLPSDRC
jgi:hypothetical protein